MLIYGSLLALVTLAGVMATTGRTNLVPRLLPMVLATIGLTLVVGLRSGVGTDTGYYALWYTRFLPQEQIWDGRDPGFTVLGKVAYHLLGANPVWLFLVAGAVTSTLVVMTLRAHSRPVPLGLALYLTTGAYFFAFNGVRQAVACAIVFSGTTFLKERRWRPFALVVFVASLFHASALIFLLIYPIITGRSAKVRAIAVIGLGVVLVGYEQVVELTSSLIGSGRFSEYSQVVLDQGQGVHVLRVMVRLVVFGAAFLRRKQLEQLLPGFGSTLVNLALVSALLYGLAARHWIYARIAVYPSMFEMLLLPAIARTFSGKTRGIFSAAVFVSFLLYISSVILGGDSDLLPYRSILD